MAWLGLYGYVHPRLTVFMAVPLRVDWSNCHIT
jgi:hypothetical protein